MVFTFDTELLGRREKKYRHHEMQCENVLKYITNTIPVTSFDSFTKWMVFLFLQLFHIQKVNNVDNESFFTNIKRIHTHTHPSSNTKIQFFIALFWTSSYMRFQCDTSLCVNVCIFFPSLSFLVMLILQFHPLPPDAFHFTFATISVPFVGLSNLNILFVETYWVHTFNATIWSFESCKKHSIHFHTRKKMKHFHW